MTWPLVARLGTQIPAGAGGDVWVHEWTFWWIERAIALGQNPFFTDLLFFPHGVSLTTHNIAWFNIGLWFPLQAVFGNHIAYSLTYPIIFTLNGLSLYLLARHWLASSHSTRGSGSVSHEQTGVFGAAFIAGLIYAFWPYLTSQSGHPNMLTVGWLPLALLYLMRIVEGGNWRDVPLAGLFIALQGIARWQLLIVGAMVMGIYVLYGLLASHRVRTWGSLGRTLAQLALSGVIALVLIAPLGGPVIAAQLTRTDPSAVLIDDGTFGVDLLAMVVPNANLGLWTGLVERLPQRLQFRHDQVDFMGYTALALAVVGAVRQRRRALVWVLIALALTGLALGSQLTVAHRTYEQISTPYAWAQNISLVRVVRAPHRFYAFAALPLGLLAAKGVLALQSGRVPGPLIAGVAAVLILGEYWVLPYRMTTLETPAWYAQLAAEPGNFGILSLPMSPRLADKYYMHYQITHGKALVEGHVSRPPQEAFAFLESREFLERLYTANELDPALGNVTHQLRPLADANVRYIVLHKALSNPEQLAAWRVWLAYAPRHEDEDVIVYSTTPQLGTDFEVAQPLTPDLGLVFAGVENAQLRQTEPLRLRAAWASTDTPARDWVACIRLLNGDGETAQKSCADVGSNLAVPYPTSQWGAGELMHEWYDFRLDPFLPPGDYAVMLSLVDSAEREMPEATVVAGAVQIAPLPRRFDPPQPAHPTTVGLGETVRLLGFDLNQAADQLQTTLYWQARTRTEKSYKVFVHLVNPTDGAVVAQWDGIPGQWSYPTIWWEAGEVVADAVTVPLTDVAPGDYRLLVGMYDEATGDRLPVAKLAAGEASGLAAEDGADDAIEIATIEHGQE